jgi:CheY-like chemotaxis protein
MPAVLVLEDDPSVCKTLCTMLTLAGFTTHRAPTVDDALAILQAQQVDAVTLDLRVPDPKGLDRSGLSLLTILRQTPGYAALPALIFTGMPLSLEEEEAARKLNAPVFYKPQSYAVLIQHLNRQLRRCRVPARLGN